MSSYREEDEAQTRGQKHRVFTYEEIHAATSGFSASALLGRGSHGSVYRASLDQGRLLAAAKLPSFPSLRRRSLATPLPPRRPPRRQARQPPHRRQGPAPPRRLRPRHSAAASGRRCGQVSSTSGRHHGLPRPRLRPPCGRQHQDRRVQLRRRPPRGTHRAGGHRRGV
ncbi:hypothetical protein MUK42_12648 [Musa troglodytarum]|uniref:Protein kinase domain-containing protein n=1 Tax=Musa troglodytarum TaxID=320322 RepID=A0A9E7GHN6_9LILI|nr:hypothetical protein MUK42_12648 [Musa troglodytarum]